MISSNSLYHACIGCVLLLFLSVAGISGCTEKSTIALTTEYQAVFLDSGQAFFGKLQNAEAPFPLLENVFYIQQQVNKETNEVKNILIKRGNEWHGPDRMYVNAQKIVLIEPVSPESQVYKLIIEAMNKNEKNEGK